MKRLFNTMSLFFSAGALGGLVNGLAVWIFGALGITAALGVQIAPELSPPFLYQKVVWGGIWGFILLVPLAEKSPWLKGLAVSLAPTLAQLLIIFPYRLHKGFLGCDLGCLTPLFVLFFNALWGITAALWYHAVRE
ncbi:MAG: hypothetical protein A2176_09725 [Spirochaetes bacterium RBG_13_51_14]|nr:MAG: hypothetical protein A2176_09725 [Spirochaetes bacterium RBG_13_51_14]